MVIHLLAIRFGSWLTRRGSRLKFRAAIGCIRSPFGFVDSLADAPFGEPDIDVYFVVDHEAADDAVRGAAAISPQSLEVRLRELGIG